MDIIAFHDCDDLHSARTQEQHYFEEYKATLNSIEPLPKPKPTITIEHEKKENPEHEKKENPEHEKKENPEHDINPTNLMCDNDNDCKKHICAECSFVTTLRHNYVRHINTKKHLRICSVKNNTGVNSVSAPNTTEPRRFICECGGVYSHRQSLFKHKQRCTFKKDDNKVFGLTGEQVRQLISQAVSAGLNSRF
jgi:hypothetical protein